MTVPDPEKLKVRVLVMDPLAVPVRLGKLPVAPA
jgi:hypothetical protein